MQCVTNFSVELRNRTQVGRGETHSLVGGGGAGGPIFDEGTETLVLYVQYTLCNGGSLYAPYSLLSISNMLCDASLLPWGEGGQGGKVSGTLRPCFQGHKVWALD
jgi:hypothetical protein